MTVYSKSMMESLAEVRGLQLEDNMDLMRKAAGGSAQNVKMKDGKLKMDAFTASAIMKVYDKVKPANKNKIETGQAASSHQLTTLSIHPITYIN